MGRASTPGEPITARAAVNVHLANTTLAMLGMVTKAPQAPPAPAIAVTGGACAPIKSCLR